MEDDRCVMTLSDPFNAIECANDPGSRAKVLQIISEIPVNERMVLLLYHYGGMGIREVAMAMGLPVWTATHHLERARGHVLKELGMNSTDTYRVPENPNGPPVLKQIFDKCAEESHTDEQVKRVLEPVLRMIAEGEFDRPWWYRFKRFVKPSH
jgi:DNA-directed RNA polymerase specialized sigma subunit, sigma24 homolog